MSTHTSTHEHTCMLAFVRREKNSMNKYTETWEYGRKYGNYVENSKRFTPARKEVVL